jgi:hypothetical protein
MQNKGSICPEYRSLRCLAGTNCSFDQRRECRVCVCKTIDYNIEPPPDQPRP